MPPYTMSETFIPPDTSKFRIERRRIERERTETSRGRETYVQPSLAVLTTMEITTKMAGHDSTSHMAQMMKDSYHIHLPTMPLHPLQPSPSTQHHTHCIATLPAPANEQSTCHMGTMLSCLQHPDQNHDTLLQHANKNQMEVQHCHILCGWSPHSDQSGPANTHAYHHTQTNTAYATNMPTKTTEKSHQHLYHPLINPPTTSATDNTAKDTAQHCESSLLHTQQPPVYEATPRPTAIPQIISNTKPSELPWPNSPPPDTHPTAFDKISQPNSTIAIHMSTQGTTTGTSDSKD